MANEVLTDSEIEQLLKVLGKNNKTDTDEVIILDSKDDKLTQDDLDKLLLYPDTEEAPTNTGKQEKEQKGTAQDSVHYKESRMQPIEVMQSILTQEEFIGYLKGNIIKYRMRARHKDNYEKDINKSYQYAFWLTLVKQNIVIDPTKHSLPKDYVYTGI